MTNNQVTLSQLIEHLQGQLEEHGDVPVYSLNHESWLVYPAEFEYFFGKWEDTPKIMDIYTNIHGNESTSDRNVDTTKPITKGLVL